MKPVSSEELSGLIDGELDAARREQILAAIEADPVLQAAYTRLAMLDRSWRAAAQTAAFRPAIVLPPGDARPRRGGFTAVAAVILAVVFRILGKFPMALDRSLALHAVALAVLIFAAMVRVGRVGSIRR